MISEMLFLTNIGSNDISSSRQGSLAISRFFGNNLIEIPSHFEPNKLLKDIKDQKGIVHLIGDVAMPNHSGLSWLEALGYWKQPVGLMIAPDNSGNISGMATAYVSLCMSKKVLLGGVVQLGGVWDQKARSLDCLPWCGQIPDEILVENCSLDSISIDQSLKLEELALNLKKQIYRTNF